MSRPAGAYLFIIKYVDSLDDEYFSTIDVACALSLSNKTVKRVFTQLVFLGYLAKRPRAYAYRYYTKRVKWIGYQEVREAYELSKLLNLNKD